MSNRNIGHLKKLTNHKENTEGLKEANKNRDTYLYLKDDTLYMGGTQNIRDVWDDVSKVPFYGDLRKSQRYQDADELLKKSPQVKNTGWSFIRWFCDFRITETIPRTQF